MRILSSDLKSHVGKTVEVSGWLHKKRGMGALMFVVLRDRHGLMQIVVSDEAEQEKLRPAQVGTVLNVKGLVKTEPRAIGGAEIHEPVLSVGVLVEEPSPIEIDKPIDHTPENLDTLFENRVVNLRNLREQAIFKVQAEVKDAIRQFFFKHDFTEFNSPKLLPGSTEGGAEVFKLDYFGQEATLAQSAQFYKQIMVGVYERVFEINPTYRAEPSATTRHMTEFMHLDVEVGFIEFDELMELAGNMLIAVTDQVWHKRHNELGLWNATKPLLSKKIPALPLAKIHELYSNANEQQTIGEDDMRPDEERWICEYAKENFSSEAIFVTDWPSEDAKFYHRIKADDPETAERFDLIFRGVEIQTGSMREHRYDNLLRQLKTKTGGNPDHPGFKYYLQAFKYGMPPHGGFAMGLERLTQKLIGLSNVKEATLFPRDMNRLAP